MPVCSSCGDTHAPDVETCPRLGTAVVNGGPCGTQIDRYQVLRWVGGGGMGAVYSARHAMVGHGVALKILHARYAKDPHLLERFMREARAAASIGNEHIVRVYDVGTLHDGRAFLAMELLEGQSLEAWVKHGGPMDTARAVHIVLQVLDALGAAHRAGIVHRDVKPANVQLMPWPGGGARGGEFVKLLDFGISKILGDGPEAGNALTKTGMVLGTPHYMAPEQFRDPRAVDHRSDLYAVAVMLYRMVAGAMPFLAESYDVLLQQVLFGAPRPLLAAAPTVPPALAQVVDRGLARDPDARFNSANDFSISLLEAMGRPRVPTPPPSMARATRQGLPSERPPPSATPAVQQMHGYAYPTPPPTPAPVAWSAQSVPFAPPPAPKKKSRWVWLILAPLLGLGIGTAVVMGFIMTQQPDGPTDPRIVPLGQTNDPTGTAPAAPGSPAAMYGSTPPAEPYAPPGQPYVLPAQALPPPAQPLPPAAATGTPGAPQSSPSQAIIVMASVGIMVNDIEIVGSVSRSAVRSAVERIGHEIANCRVAGRAEHVSSLVIVSDDGSMPIGRPGNDNTGDPDVATCVAHVLQGAGPLPSGQTGIVTVTVTLAPR